MKKLSHLKSQAGYILLSLMALTALIPGLVLVGLNYTDIIEQGSRISKTTITKTQMHTIRNIVANAARDVDADGAFDVWREGAGNTVPATVTVNSRDQWGTDFRYCAYDLLACNQVDAAFSQNNPNAPCVGFSPPTTNLVLRVISAGRDRVFQTDCRSTSALGDDIVMDEVEAGIRAGVTGGTGGGAASGGATGGGWTDDGSVVRLTDPNDRVGIGTATPGARIHVRDASGLSPQAIYETTVTGAPVGLALKNALWEIRLRTNPNRGWFEVADSAGSTRHRWEANDYLMASNGILGWSSETNFATAGVGARDTSLYRNAANVLRTPGSLIIDRNVSIGTTNSRARLDVVGSEIFNAINDPLAMFGTAGPSNSNSIIVYNGAGSTSLFISGNPDNFMLGTVAGDGGIRVTSGRSLFFGDTFFSRMVINPAGNVGIGTINPIRRLDVHGGIIAFSYEHHSSRDSKSNIQTMKAEEALSILNQLRPVEFKYKDDPEERRLGFIAEEVPVILTSEDRQGVRIMDTVAVLTKVIQEQQKKIEKLKSDIEQLESNNATTSQNSDKIDIDTAFKIIAMSLLIALSIKISEARYKTWLKR